MSSFKALSPNLENIELVTQNQNLFFEQKSFLFFKRFREVDESIFVDHPQDSF